MDKRIEKHTDRLNDYSHNSKLSPSMVLCMNLYILAYNTLFMTYLRIFSKHNFYIFFPSQSELNVRVLINTDFPRTHSKLSIWCFYSRGAWLFSSWIMSFISLHYIDPPSAGSLGRVYVVRHNEFLGFYKFFTHSTVDIGEEDHQEIKKKPSELCMRSIIMSQDKFFIHDGRKDNFSSVN